MKVNITKADEEAIKEGIEAFRQHIKRGSLSRHQGQKGINGLKKILAKHEERKAKSY